MDIIMEIIITCIIITFAPDPSLSLFAWGKNGLLPIRVPGLGQLQDLSIHLRNVQFFIIISFPISPSPFKILIADRIGITILHSSPHIIS